MDGKLFDSSGLINCVWMGKAEKAAGQHTIELVKYEIGNYAWKRRSELREEECLRILEKLLELVETMKVLNLDFKESLLLAVREGISFYDSSYLQAALRNGLTLVTDDSRLREAASKHVKVLGSSEV
ncbi:MAG: type II toxin-antitoxin system VapC family toxin [Candidatus Bathyarchaeia archaeon]